MVFLHEAELALVLLQLRDLPADLKGDWLLISSVPGLAEQIQITDVQRPDAVELLPAPDVPAPHGVASGFHRHDKKRRRGLLRRFRR